METKKCIYLFLSLAFVVSVWTISTPSVVFAQHVDDLILMTEQYPPFNFKKDGKLQGISVDMIVLMLEKIDAKLTRKNIRLLPWARGYSDVLSKKKYMSFFYDKDRRKRKVV